MALERTNRCRTPGTPVTNVGEGVVYSVFLAGKIQNILVAIGSNGYVVSAYPWSK